MNDGDIVRVLPDLGDLILEVEVSQLGNITGLEVVDRFGHSHSHEGR